MSEMIDMKRDEKKSGKEKAENMAYSPMESPYPYGLRLSLDDETLKKLGIKTLPKVGAKLQIHAVGVVTDVSSNEHEKDGLRRNVGIQIQRLSAGKGGASVEDAIEAGIEDADEYKD